MMPDDDDRSGGAPVGTVTFLLTDIEGSTRLWDSDPEAMAGAIARHDELVDDSVEKFGGFRPKEQGEGDSVVVVFPRASDAVACALDVQRAFLNEDWGRVRRIPVRMAIHTGEAQVRDDSNYFGQAIIRCARLRSIAHGGQVLCSRSTYDLVLDRLPEGATLKDLGPHRLKDLSRPEHVYQLVHPDLPSEFPRLASLELLPNNLPLQLTSFVGRESEIVEVKSLLERGRLVTLTGAGGAGKTRLALQVAADLLDAYPDGVWWVDLSPVVHPELVAKTLASSLQIREVPMQEMAFTLRHQLRDRRLLILLDNCEHLISACAKLAQGLLQSCPALKILATSQEPLGVAGENAWRVPSLSLPDAKEAELASLSRSESVRLLLDRIAKFRPDYSLTSEDAPFLSEICRTLDGMPLALELAAARVRLLSLRQIAEGLNDRFRMLVGGSRTALPRHQTLQASVDWSHNLLTDEEKTLFRRLSVFVGGFSLGAAEQICSEAPLRSQDLLDLISQLIDKSLLQIDEGGPPRFRLQETIRQYAKDRLRESADEDAVRNRHLDFYLAMAEEAEPHLEYGETLALLEQLATEHDNLRVAMDWCQSSGAFDKGLRLASALQVFWLVRGHISEGRTRLERGLEAAEVEPTLRAKGLIAASAVADWVGDFPALGTFAGEALEIGRSIDDPRTIARALGFLGSRAIFVEPESAGGLLEESIALARKTPDPWCVAFSLNGLGLMQMVMGRPGEGVTFIEESLSIARSCGDRMGIQRAVRNLGTVYTFQGKLTQARVLLDEGLEIARQFEDTSAQAVGLTISGLNSIYRGEYAAARQFLEEALKLAEDSGSPPIAAMAMAALGVLNYALGDLSASSGRLDQGVQLFAAMGLNWAVSAFQPYLGDALEAQGKVEDARATWKEALRLARESDLAWTLGRTLRGMGKLRRVEGDLEAAEILQTEAVGKVGETGDLMALTDSLEELAMVVAGRGDLSRAARLFGAVQSVRDSTGYVRFPVARAVFDHHVQKIREGLSVNVCEQAWTEGTKMSPKDAIALAVGH